MTIKLPLKNNASALFFIPICEAISDTDNGGFLTELMPSIALYWCRPNQLDDATHHRCEPLKKFDPRDTDPLAEQAALDVLNNPLIALRFIAAICEEIRGIKDE